MTLLVKPAPVKPTTSVKLALMLLKFNKVVLVKPLVIMAFIKMQTKYASPVIQHVLPVQVSLIALAGLAILDTIWNGSDSAVNLLAKLALMEIAQLTCVYCVITHVKLVLEVVQINALYVLLDISKEVRYV